MASIENDFSAFTIFLNRADLTIENFIINKTQIFEQFETLRK